MWYACAPVSTVEKILNIIKLVRAIRVTRAFGHGRSQKPTRIWKNGRQQAVYADGDTGLLRRLPVGTEAASRVRVRIAGRDDDVGRRLAFFLVRGHPVGYRRRSPPQEVLRPFGLPFLDRNAFRRGHPFGVVLSAPAKIKTGNINIILAEIFNGLKKKIVKKKTPLKTKMFEKFYH